MSRNKRKCLMCGDLAYEINEEDEIHSIVNEDGTFMVCFFSEAWEICRKIGDAPLAGVEYVMKNGECIGRLRELS